MFSRMVTDYDSLHNGEQFNMISYLQQHMTGY